MYRRHRPWDSGARIAAATVAFLATFSLSCLFDNREEESPVDVTPPAAVTDLVAGAQTDSSVALTWTAPGNDGTTGTASSYDLRTSISPITADNWSAATPATSVPPPRPAGETESFLLAGLQAGTDYFVALRTADGASNLSALSNVLYLNTRSVRAAHGALLAEFASAHTSPRRDLAAVGACLHPDFLFLFTDTDRQGDPEIPEAWNSDPFLVSVGHMLEYAESITMSVSIRDELAAEPCTPGGTDTCYIYEADVRLTIEVPVVPPQTEPMTFLAQGLADFVVTRHPAEPTGWVIYQVLDRTNELGGGKKSRPSATEPATWGAILAMYH